MVQKIKVIAAMTQNRAIGAGGSLIVSSLEDMRHFKKQTEGHIVIMGRKTFESLPDRKPLRNRINIVLTNDSSYLPPPGVVLASTLKEAIAISRTFSEKDIYIIGGGSIYEQSLKYADMLILTTFHNIVYEEADTFFPQFGKEFSLNTTCYIKPDITVKYYINNDRKTI